MCTGQYVQALEMVADGMEAASEPVRAEAYRHTADIYLEWIEEMHQNESGTYPEQKLFHQPPRTNEGFPIPPLEGWTLLPWSEVEVRKAVTARNRG